LPQLDRALAAGGTSGRVCGTTWHIAALSRVVVDNASKRLEDVLREAVTTIDGERAAARRTNARLTELLGATRIRCSLQDR
jgi:hypothetical protein